MQKKQAIEISNIINIHYIVSSHLLNFNLCKFFMEILFGNTYILVLKGICIENSALVRQSPKIGMTDP